MTPRERLVHIEARPRRCKIDIDRSFSSNATLPHRQFQYHVNSSVRPKRDMASSKFVEILDNSDAPYSHENVSLEDVLKETRARSESASSESSTRLKSSSRERSPETSQNANNLNHGSTLKTRLRGLSVRKPKS